MGMKEGETMRELIDAAIGMGIEINMRQAQQFERYWQLLVQWNEKMNLTAISDKQQVIQKHFLDSLAPLACGLIPTCARIVDVGTGAGFPGIPLLIMRPGLQLTLSDSLRKRLDFLREVLAVLELEAELLHIRAEDMGRSAAHREQYDLVLSRAVAPLNVLCELTLPLVRVGGASICYKGAKAEEEIRQAEHAIERMGGILRAMKKITIPGLDASRCLIVLYKRKACLKGYPRKAGIPAKEPI